MHTPEFIVHGAGKMSISDDYNKITQENSMIQAHGECVSACFLCYDDAVIVTASHDGTAALWSRIERCKQKALTGHTDRITDCSVEEKNHRLLTCSWDKSIRLWDTQSTTNEPIWSSRESSLLLSCDLNHCHQLAAAAADSGHTHLWDTRSGEKITTLKGHTNTAMCCRFDYGGSKLCTCSMDRTAIVWDIRMLRYLLKLSDHKLAVSCCAFSHNNHWLLTGSWDKSLYLYNVADGTYRTQGPIVLRQHHGCICSCNFSRDDSLIVSAGYDCDVNVWSRDNHQLRNTYKGHTTGIRSADFGKNKKWIVTGDQSGQVRFWDTEAGNESEIRGHPAMISSKCLKCGELYSPIPLSRPHSLQINSGLCLLCMCRSYNLSGL